MTEKELIAEEWERCKNDFCYFYNTYTNVGKIHPIPEELWKDVNEQFNGDIEYNTLQRSNSFSRFVKIKKK